MQSVTVLELVTLKIDKTEKSGSTGENKMEVQVRILVIFQDVCSATTMESSCEFF